MGKNPADMGGHVGRMTGNKRKTQVWDNLACVFLIEAGTRTIITAAKKSRLEMCIEIQSSTVVQARGN